MGKIRVAGFPGFDFKDHTLLQAVGDQLLSGPIHGTFRREGEFGGNRLAAHPVGGFEGGGAKEVAGRSAEKGLRRRGKPGDSI